VLGVSCQSQGQGHETTFAQIVAEELGIPPEDIEVVHGDTDRTPFGLGTYGSRSTPVSGAATAVTARKVREKARQIAAAMLEASPDDLEIVDNAVVVRGVPDRSITLAAIGKKTNTMQSKLKPVHGAGTSAVSVQAPAFAAQLAEIEVDPETGLVTVHDFAAIQDVGFAINPLGIEGQMQGGAVQSLGIALTEGLQYDEQGRLMNPSLLDYRKLTAADLPNIDTVLVAVPSPAGPMGARGVGEPPIVPAPATIANAVEDAVGVRITETPLSAEKVRRALND
jgi:carbon-monoxide dehydrogenase large subunit